MKTISTKTQKNTSIIDVNDILEVLGQNNFSNQTTSQKAQSGHRRRSGKRAVI
jgi:hypothetical protein